MYRGSCLTKELFFSAYSTYKSLDRQCWYHPPASLSRLHYALTPRPGPAAAGPCIAWNSCCSEMIWGRSQLHRGREGRDPLTSSFFFPAFSSISLNCPSTRFLLQHQLTSNAILLLFWSRLRG